MAFVAMVVHLLHIISIGLCRTVVVLSFVLFTFRRNIEPSIPMTLAGVVDALYRRRQEHPKSIGLFMYE